MSLQRSQIRYTVDEYTALERQSEERHEYLDGFVHAMAGESPEHGTICMNLSRIISTQLLDKPCQAFSKDTKVQSGPMPKRNQISKGLYSYPDLVVVCGEMEFLDSHRDVLLNPTLILEVLSPSTEAFDRGTKWARYQSSLPGLRDCVLVSQSRPQIERYYREIGDDWSYARIDDIEATVHIDSIDCRIALKEVYHRIVFPAEGEDGEFGR
jgi:Uma2 family endonuclease